MGPTVVPLANCIYGFGTWLLTWELAVFHVRYCVSDGASINRKFDKMHALDYPGDSATHQPSNRYDKGESRTLYFVNDTCHLMKTTRNGLENTGGNKNSRRLVVN